MKNRATEALLKCGLSMNLKGFHYIVDAMRLLDEGWFGEKFMALYAKIAKINNSTPSRVERALRHALEIILTKCPLEEVSMYFDLQNKTNSAQLTCFYYRLCKEREMEEKANE